MDRNETRLHDRPAEMAEQQAAQQGASAASGGAAPGGAAGQPSAAAGSASATARQPAPAVHARTLPVGEFHPPSHRRQRGLASRSWVPVALSFGTALLVAIALVIYFSQHQ